MLYTKNSNRFILKVGNYYMITQPLAVLNSGIVKYKGYSRSSQDPKTIYHLFQTLGEDGMTIRLIRRQLEQHLKPILNIGKPGGSNNAGGKQTLI